MRSWRLLLVALVLAASAGCGAGGGNGAHPRPGTSASTGVGQETPSPGPSRSGAPTPDATRPCGSAPVARYRHVVWIWMENKGYGDVIGSSEAPFENALAGRCGLAAAYHGVAHPSLPNYLAATGGSTFGVTDDGDPAAHPIPKTSLFGQVDAAGLTWRSYQEGMSTPCQLTSSGRYAVKHNPAAYFTDLRPSCRAHDVPLAGHLAADIAGGTLPAFAVITPDLCHDTHDCPVAVGDTWLRTWVTRILDGPNYRSGDTALVITWDEAEGSSTTVPAIVVGPSVPTGTVSRARFDHLSLLRTTEDLLGLPPLRGARTATSMVGAFHLAGTER